MQLKVLHNQVSELILKKSIAPKEGENLFDFKYRVCYDKNRGNVFGIIFNTTIDKPKDFTLEVEYITWFDSSENLTEEFKSSSFPIVNAPSIAFPFLRSFISTITLNAGYSPVLIPSINFQSETTQERMLEPC